LVLAGAEHNRQREMSRSIKSREYTEASTSAGFASDSDANYVRQRLMERGEAKSSRNFDLADEIRDELQEEYNVVIDDRSKQYSVGGDFGKQRREYGSFSRRGGGELSPEDEEAIINLVEERADVKKSRNYAKADEIRDILLDTYNVKVDDRNKEWQVQTNEFFKEKMEPGARVLTDAQIATVEAKLIERAMAKKDRRFDYADDIRDELKDKFSVVVNDRTLSWKTMTKADRRKLRDDGDYEPDMDAISEAADLALRLEAEAAVGDDENVSLSEEYEETISDQIVENPELSRDELTSLTLPELKVKLREVGKPVSGNKADLVDRILSP
jgi:cysteinyl-tRNA synthetase